MTNNQQPVVLYHGDALEVLAGLPADSLDAVVTDPPYELGFMGKPWDGSGIAYNVDLWKQCLRVLKPGGHLLAFGGTRTSHRLTCAVEDAGFEIRDTIMWLYGSGFPKSLDVSKAIDKAAGVEREVVGRSSAGARSPGFEARDRGHVKPAGPLNPIFNVTAPATDDAKRWAGWGTALKPAWESIVVGHKPVPLLDRIGSRLDILATSETPHVSPGAQGGSSHEPIVVARKPLTGTVAQNVVAHGTGALNIDACRVAFGDDDSGVWGNHGQNPANHQVSPGGGGETLRDSWHSPGSRRNDAGRWPTNVVLSHAPLLDEDGAPVGDACAAGCVPGCPVAELDEQSGALHSQDPATRAHGGKAKFGQDGWRTQRGAEGWYGDSGGASRFFPTFRYQAKAPTRERPKVDGTAHPTVKPLALMRWLVRLAVAPGGVVLDPFVGSGTTAEACVAEDVRCIAIEREADYLPLIAARLERAIKAASD